MTLKSTAAATLSFLKERTSVQYRKTWTKVRRSDRTLHKTVQGALQLVLLAKYGKIVRTRIRMEEPGARTGANRTAYYV
jgi:hypothetical protein